MTTLVTLPADLLEFVLGFDCCGSVIQLWKCGNKRLNATIACACTEVSLEDCKWNSTSRFPRMLRHLRRLKSLRIDRQADNRSMDAEELGLELQQLSPTLESLELICAEAESCFVSSSVNAVKRMIGTEGDSISNVKSESTGDTPKNTSGSRLWNVGSFFPNLKTLILRSERPSLSSEDLLALPETLTQLVLPSNATQTADERFPSLPRNLRTLHIRGGQWRPKYMQQLPPNLIELGMLNTTTECGLEFWTSLPRSLTLLSLPMCFYIPATPEVLRSLPPQLGNVVFGKKRNDWGRHTPEEELSGGARTFAINLPSNLTSLQFTDSDYLEISRHLELALLPRTITKLRVPSIDWSVNWPSPKFPPLLSSLAVENVLDWSEEHWKILETLETPLCMMETRVIREDVAKFPSSLAHLQLNNSPQTKFLPRALPERLETLFANHYRVDPSELSRLPRTLNKLAVTLVRCPSLEEALHWPPRLQHLVIKMCEEYTPDEDDSPEDSIGALFHIPSSVQQFEVQLLLEHRLTKQDFLALPRGLTSLVMASSDGALMEPDAFSALPTTLHSLESDIFPSSPDSEIDLDDASDFLQHLPRNLKRLYLPSAPPFLDKHFRMLPRSLHKLWVYPKDVSKLTKLSAEYMPPHVKKLMIQKLPAEAAAAIDLLYSTINETRLSTPDPRLTRSSANN